MQVKVWEFEAIKTVFEQILPHGEEFNALPEEKQDMIVNGHVAILNIYKRHKKDNKRTANYIAEKRITNPDYAR